MVQVHTFSVLGNPVPQGSMRAFVVNGRAVLTSSTKNLKEWRNLIAYQANTYLTEVMGRSLPWEAAATLQRHPASSRARLVGFFSYAEPVKVTAKFYFARPKSHLKKSGKLTKSAPRSKHSKPDVDKLARAVLDALTGVFFEDDSQVVFLTVEKSYADPGIGPGVEISIEKYTETDE